MADYEQVLQLKMATRRREHLKSWIDAPTAPPLAGDETSDEGGVIPSSEYSLHFKMILVPRGSAARASYRSQTLTSSPDSWPLTPDDHLQANSTV